MPEAINASNISTNYYKLAHINSVTYSIYSTNGGTTDQTLLELELRIRHAHPKCLITYYNKYLYSFQFNHVDEAVDLTKGYPMLQLKHSNAVGADLLASPPKPSNDKDGPATKENEYLPYASLSFLKAVKKLVLFNLSSNGVVRLFGNYSVIKEDGNSNFVLHIDPILLSNGDLLLCVLHGCHLQLFNSSILDVDNASQFAGNFAIYIIPSGIRCHLYDGANITSNFTSSPPKNKDSLLQLIKYSTGVDLTPDDNLTWIKLVPNLQHLNNQTSKISKFIHSVDNKKFILWPWSQCLLQFGHNQKTFGAAQTVVNSSDPLNLISDFIDFNISHHQQANIGHQPNQGHQTQNQGHNFSIPSAMSTGVSSTGAMVDNKGDSNMIDIAGPGSDIFGEQSAEAHEFFDTSNFQSSLNPEQQKVGSQEVQKDENDEDVEMDDLFGDVSETEQASNEVLVSGVTGEANDFEDLFADDIQTDKIDEKDNTIKKEEGESSREENDKVEELKNFKDLKPQPPSSTLSNTFIDIPKNQMTIPSMRNLKQTPQIYNDPGAPMPIMPTPILPQFGANSTAPGSAQSVNAPSAAPTDTENNDGPRSIFSPILFNPIIKSNIDTKYGKGGKFYVDKEMSAGPDIDMKRRTIRATSVNGFEFPLKRDDTIFGDVIPEDDDKKGLNIDFLDEIDADVNPKNEDRKHRLSMEDRSKDEVNLGEAAKEDEEQDGAEDEEEEEDEEESDEDEDQITGNNDNSLKNSPPLKLNTLNDPFIAQQNQTGFNYNDTMQNAKQAFSTSYNMSSLNTGGLSSPNSNGFSSSRHNGPTHRFDSPFGLHTIGDSDNNNGPALTFGDNAELMQHQQEHDAEPEKTQAQTDNSPMVMEVDIVNKSSHKESEQSSNITTPNSRGSVISESSNCLPLILRGINVSTIPTTFILHNIRESINIPSISTDFNMDADDDTEWSDYELSKNDEMVVKLNNLDEFLKWLGPTLIFDMGLNKVQEHLEMKLPDNERNAEGYSNIDGKVPPQAFEEKLCNVFPFCYKVNLNEFMNGATPNELNGEASGIQEEIDNQLSFLDDITNDDLLNLKSQLKKLHSLEWDSIYSENDKNEENSIKYREIIHNISQNSIVDSAEEGSIFPLPNSKARVLKHEDSILNLNAIGVKFWKYLNFSPINGPKNFQMLLVSENDHNVLNHNYNLEFLNSLIYNYKECHFGSISKISLQSQEPRPDLESMDSGVLLVNKEEGGHSYGATYKQIDRKLNLLVEMIKSDLINKTNRFEFDRPLLLLFINFDKNVNSLLQISKVIRNFKLYLGKHQLPLVEVFAHVIPSSLVVRQKGGHRRLKYLSNYRLSKLSMNLYNQCPNERSIGNTNKDPTKHLFTQLVKEPPTKLHFKFLNNGGNSKTAFNDDIFLHLAYERSIDKNWFSAAWSDPLGIITLTKSWFCSPALKNSNNKNVYDLGAISDEIWSVSNTLFKKLNDEIIERTSGLGGKKFLVLTRINSIIPDDELVHWKRLSVKHKDISLIVLSVNSSPKLLFHTPASPNEQENNDGINPLNHAGTREGPFPPNPAALGANGGAHKDFFRAFSTFAGSKNSSPNHNGTHMAISPSHNDGTFHSPQQFLNAPGNFFSPQDLAPSSGGTLNPPADPDAAHSLQDLVVHDPSQEVMAAIPEAPLPSFSSPTRLGMKIGYLLKDCGLCPDRKRNLHLVYEVNLLSCSNYWDLNAIMSILLCQYKKLITLNDVLCVREIDGNIGENLHQNPLLFAPENSHILNYTASSLVPWHIAAVTKSLDYLVHIDVEE